MKNIILNTDSYKASHYLQYPPKSEFVSSYVEARGGEYEEVLFFGLQVFIKEYLLTPFTQSDIDEAKDIFEAHGVPFNIEGWQYILDKYNGYLPIEIEAIPEGVVVPTKTALVQVINTDPKLPWLTSYIETSLLRAIWYPTTVATVSWRIKRLIREYLEETSESVGGLEFKLHDFGSRGVSSKESAEIGGMAHLINFMGTDTISAIVSAKRYYNCKMAGFSIPAAEHSTITSWGRDGEVDAYRNMLKQFAKPNSLVAVVSDSYDIYNAVSKIWGEELKQEVIDSKATLIIRPDSGEPKEVVVEILKRLYEKFGGSINKKGYIVLNNSVRVIQGDGIEESSIKEILENMKKHNFSADNIAFGMGGALLQKPNRDTLSFAMKASAIRVDGKWRDVYKDPITDSGKRSKKGRLAVVKESLETIRAEELNGRDNLFETIFRDGKLLKEISFSEVKENSK